MRDPKLWIDLVAALWLVLIASVISTYNWKSAIVLQCIPILLAIGLAMSQARTVF